MSTAAFPKPKISLLCAEDDPVAGDLLNRIIAKKFPEIKIFAAENGKIGLELFRDKRPDIVITDLRMPIVDGIQMAGEIKAMSPETVIIVVSAHSDTHFMLKAIEIGINYYVMKPIDHRRLISTIEKSIAGINLLWQVKAQENKIQQLASFTQICPNPVIETDITGKITYYNEAAVRTLRKVAWSSELELLLPEDLQDVLRIFLDGKGDQVIREVRINDSFFEENIHFARQFDTVRIYAADISERRKLQDELLKAQKLESLGLLAGGIAHGFNNILTAILGNLSLARMQLDHSHPVAKRLSACEKTQQLLTFSQGGEPVKRPIAPAPLIRNTASLVLRGTNVKVANKIDADLWCVEADGGQLGQAMQNLLINAVQAMPEGGEITVRAGNETLVDGNPQLLPAGHYLRVSIEDHGCGIPRDNLIRIFDPYFTTKPLGTGLGLSAVYSIVKKHGGKVEASSTVGQGSCFTVYIPAIPGNGPEAAAVGREAEPAANGRVLILDDEEFIREIAAEILAYLGFAVESCADGKEAVTLFKAARARNAPFNAVILDLTVPGGMGGKEVASRLLRIDPNAVLIVSSGYSNDPVVANCRQYGFSGAIIKPFDVETLAAEFERLFPGGQAP